MTNSTTSVEMRDGGAPWPPIGGGIAVTIEPATPPVTPEMRLYRAVLEQALLDLDVTRHRPQRRRAPKAAEILRWFRSTDTSWPFAFESVCAALGLDASAVRRSVLPMTRPAAPRFRMVLAGDKRLHA
jgi:hypothetical protein